jgi:DNA-binding transcriptional regulator PaaX
MARNRIREWTKEGILKLAKHEEFFVHKYAHKASAIRKKTRRMCKDGLLVMVRSDRDHFYYRSKE